MHRSTSGSGIIHDGTTYQQTGGHTLILIIPMSSALDLRLFHLLVCFGLSHSTSDLREAIEFLSSRRYPAGWHVLLNWMLCAADWVVRNVHWVAAQDDWIGGVW